MEETVFWAGAIGLGVSGGEVVGTEQAEGYTLCSKGALQMPIVVAWGQGRGFCKWRQPKPPQEVDLSMEAGGLGVSALQRMRPLRAVVAEWGRAWLRGAVAAGEGKGLAEAGGWVHTLGMGGKVGNGASACKDLSPPSPPPP